MIRNRPSAPESEKGRCPLSSCRRLGCVSGRVCRPAAHFRKGEEYRSRLLSRRRSKRCFMSRVGCHFHWQIYVFYYTYQPFAVFFYHYAQNSALRRRNAPRHGEAAPTPRDFNVFNLREHSVAGFFEMQVVHSVREVTYFKMEVVHFKMQVVHFAEALLAFRPPTGLQHAKRKGGPSRPTPTAYAKLRYFSSESKKC